MLVEAIIQEQNESWDQFMARNHVVEAHVQREVNWSKNRGSIIRVSNVKGFDLNGLGKKFNEFQIHNTVLELEKKEKPNPKAIKVKMWNKE